MSEEQVMPTVESIEQLDSLDLTNTETTRPVLKEDVYKVRLLRLELKDQKGGAGKNLKVILALDQEAKSKDGKDVHAGFQHTETISLVPTENYNPAENLARVQECFTGQKGKWNSAALIGKQGNVRMRIEVDKTGQFGEQNRVTWLKAKAATASAVPTLG